MSIVVNRTGFDIKLSEVQQPLISRVGAYHYRIVRQDLPENLPMHYVEVYVDGNYLFDTQNETVNLKSLIAPMNKVPIEIKFIAKRITDTATIYAEPYYFLDRNMVVRWTLLCNNDSIIQE